MILLVDKNTTVLIDIVDEISEVVNGYLIKKGDEKYIYPFCFEMNHIPVESIPEGVSPQKYLYDDGEFVENPEWVDPTIPPEVTPEQEAPPV